MRIHELAKELGVESREILASLQEMGFEGRTASSTVPEEAVRDFNQVLVNMQLAYASAAEEGD